MHRRKIHARPRPKDRGGREKPAPAERDFRGSRPALLRPDRRPRHPDCSSARSSFSRRRTSRCCSTSSPKGQRLRARARAAGQIPRPRPLRADTGETADAAARRTPNCFGKTLAKFADTNNKIVAITGAMPTGTGLVHFAAKNPRQVFRRRHRRGTRRALSPAASPCRDSSRSSRSTPPSCSAPTT
jgi:hypothetical protein